LAGFGHDYSLSKNEEDENLASLKAYSLYIKNVKKRMLFNPLAHFALMFNSSNYNDPITYAHIMGTNLFIRGFDNWHYIVDEKDLESELNVGEVIKRKNNFARSVYPEAYYALYISIDLLLIMIL
jgi:hypothetical protein